MRLDLKPPVIDSEVRFEGGRRAWVRRILFEPLVHFVVIGTMLALVAFAWQRHIDIYRIVVTPARTAQLARKYELQFGTLPDAATLDQLVKDDIHDEILFRQGEALKLDQDDEIIRRRVVQKEQFLMQNLAPAAEPTDGQLQAYYAAHADRYVAPPRATFSHIYFAAGAGGDGAAEARAKAALGHVPAGVTRGPELGDPFPDIYDFSAFEPEQTARLFGHTAFTDAVFTAPVGRWVGPFRSAYGWHLLYVSARAPKQRLALADISDRVRTDYLQATQDNANDTAFDRIAKRFTVVREDRKGAP